MGPRTAFRVVKCFGVRSASRRQKGRRSGKSVTDKQNNEHLLILRELKRTKVVIAHGMLVWVAVRKVPLQLSTTPTLNTSKPFSFTRRHTVWGPPTCRVVIVKAMLSLFGQLRLDPARSTHGFDFVANPPRRMEFLKSHPMFPLWVVQLLPTSPDLPVWSRWPPSSTCTAIEREGICWDSKDVRRVSTWAS